MLHCWHFYKDGATGFPEHTSVRDDMEGIAHIEIIYCVGWGYFLQAAWIAAEMFAESGNQVDITMTPAGGGTLEVILDGDKIYDRKAEDGKYPDLPRVKELKKALKEKLEAVPA